MENKPQTKVSSNLILVAGATGNLGGAIAQILLAQGRNVRVLVRPNSNYQPLAQAGANPVFGDLKDPASLSPACEDVDTVITTANSALRGGEDNPQTVDLQGNRNLIDAAKSAGVKQFIFVSMVGADPNSPVPLFQAKAKAEEYLRQSGVPYTIVAPNAFMEVWLGMAIGVPAISGQPITIVGAGQRKHSFISVVDVTKFILASIQNPAAINQRLAIGGPQPISFRDAIDAFEQALENRKLVVDSVAPGQPVPGLPMFMAQNLAGFEFFDSPMEMKQLSTAFGVEQTSLPQFARGFVDKARAQH